MTPTAETTLMHFCAMRVDRVGGHFSVSGLVLGPFPEGQILVAVDSFDTNTCFSFGDPAVQENEGGYYFLSEVRSGEEWSRYDPSTIGRDKLTLRRYVTYHLGDQKAVDAIEHQADKQAGLRDNRGFVLAGSGLTPALARLTIEPTGTALCRKRG